jgi:xanthine dehydrogenase molybdopterin-binding subunit B
MAIKKSKYFFEEGFIETIGEVTEEKYKSLPENDKLKYIGKKINRYDGYAKVSGNAKYTFDIKLPGMAYARILGSPYPNAKVKSIDDNKARKVKGVIDIIHKNNIDPIPWYSDNGNLFDENVKHEGDEVACVVAESEVIAERALKLINDWRKQYKLELLADWELARDRKVLRNIDPLE